MIDHEVLKDLQKFRDFGTFDLTVKLKQTNIKMYDLFFENMRCMRISYQLEYLANTSEERGEYKTATIKELYNSMGAEITRSFIRYAPMFIQNLCNHLQRIQLKPALFAKVIIEHYTNDPTNFKHFAYSTFPAIYGHFIAKEFLRDSSRFLVEFFNTSKNSKLSVELIGSYFISATVFYDTFFFTVAHMFDKVSDLMTITIDALKTARSKLSTYHIDALAAFCKNFPADAVKFFVYSCLDHPFRHAAISSPYFNDRLKCIEYTLFLKGLLKSTDERVLTILTEFVYADVEPENYAALSLTDVGWKGSVPMIFSDRDIHTLHDILSSSKVERFYFPKELPVFSDSFDPYFIDVFPRYPSKDFDVKHFGNELFGVEPKEIQIQKNEAYNRLFRQALSKAADELISPEEAIKNLFGDSHDLELKEYMIKKLLKSYTKNFYKLEQAILKEEICRDVITFNTSVLKSMHYRFHTITIRTIKGIPTGADISESIAKEIHELAGNCDQHTFYELLVSMLDVSHLKLTDEAKKLMREFAETIDGWAASEYSQDKSENHIKTTQMILEFVTALKNASWKLGKMLKQIVEFVRQLKLVLGVDWEDRWKSVFGFVLMGCAQQSILPIFLFYFHFIFSYDVISLNLPAEIIDDWQKFTAGMWHVISMNRKIQGLCVDPSYALKLFSVTN